MLYDKLKVFKCEVCGNIVEVLHHGGGELVCCSQKMKEEQDNTTDAATEKHVPLIESMEGGYKVKVGSVAHPMIEKHYIEWVELIINNKIYRKHLKPEELPEVIFEIKLEKASKIKARAYCNLHGLWKSEI